VMPVQHGLDLIGVELMDHRSSPRR